MTRLDNGQTFPSLQLTLAGGRTVSLPDHLAGKWGVVLVYRGSWCPYCNAQLAGFNRAADKLQAAGVSVVALSVDDESTTQALIDRHHLSFPVAHSADADQMAAAIGSYTNDEPHYLQSTGVILAPNGTVVTAVYSSGAIGRLVADDVLGLITYLKEHS
jgi:peroxiredoxin